MAKAGILLADRHARGAPDRGTGLAGDDDLLPGRRRYLDAGADDLDLVAIRQAGDQRHDRTVDLGADRGVADIGVDGIGEIDRGRAARQGDQLALRRETEDLVLEQLELGMLEELLRAVALGQGLDRMAQPRIGIALARQKFAVAPALAILVERMRGNAVFGDLVHALGADLQLDALT